MTDGVHIRLMVTRGVKRTPYQDPRATVGAATVVIIPEYKTPKPETLARGLTLFTVHVRRGFPDVQDPKLNSPQQAQLHHRLHPGDRGRRRRSADARSARLRRDVQLDALLHRAQRRGVDIDRRLLPRRHHARERAASLPRRGHRRARTQFQPHRRLRRRRSLRHRHVRRHRAGDASIDGREISRGRGPMVERLQRLYRDLVERDVAAARARRAPE